MAITHLSTDADWAAELISGMPPRFQKRATNYWLETRGGDATDNADSALRRRSNLALLDVKNKLGAVRLPLKASDADICARAAWMASTCAGMADTYHDAKALRAAMERFVVYNHCTPPEPECVDEHGVIQGVRDLAAIKRMSCEQWWRKCLRKLHNECVEAVAIMLGFVGRGRNVYISNESFERHQQQQKRNADMLENTVLRNELDQEYLMAELAALGVANKRIRRAELMTRINGFELIANDMGHIGMFFTITPPSRMHRWHTLPDGQLVRNHRYDGTTPKQAQKYLCHVWKLIRTKLHNDGFQWYGVRAAQPHHEGSPHWHGVVFFPQDHEGMDAYEYLCGVIRHYALKDSPDEPGALQHRCDFKLIDRDKGTAAGYVLRYVVRATDGEGLDRDPFDQPGHIAAKRINAWASTWSIRLFQQVGGPPVGVWREMRRIKELPHQAPEALRHAHNAVNRLTKTEGEVQPASFCRYIEAMGGIFATRKDFRIRLHKEKTDRVGRYGDVLSAEVRGVESAGIVVHSVRHVWEVVRRKAREGFEAGIARPWTRVNNCTHAPGENDVEYAERELSRHEFESTAPPFDAWLEYSQQFQSA
ncbi:replication endonuclease [Pandoraea sp. B-6]|uniref:replication endonuclease n=1 Tax=Pandoraea sp. B-6 TaxID=1204340 RepID=UPI0003470A0C|nr:replication endonuclease [Pandoraea sp. B-6]